MNEVARTGITRSGSTATVTTVGDHHLVSGLHVAVDGAAQPEYNGIQVITVTGDTTFTYSVSGSPATPADSDDGLWMGGAKGSDAPFAAIGTPGTVAGKVHYDVLTDMDPMFKEFGLLEGRVKETRADETPITSISGGNHPGEMYFRVYPEDFDESMIRAIWSGDGTAAVGGGGNLPNIELTANGDNATVKVYDGGLALAQLSAPKDVTVTTGGMPGSTTYVYRVVPFDAAGNQGPVSDAVSIATGNAVLSASNYNRVTWSQVIGAEYYYVLRTNSEAESYTDKALVAPAAGTDCAVDPDNDGICSIGAGNNLQIIRIDGATKVFIDKGFTATGTFEESSRNATSDLLLPLDSAIRLFDEDGGTPRLLLGNSNFQFDVDVIPSEDAMYNCGAQSRRWANLYVASSHIGDLIFSNDLVLTEHSNLLGDVPRGVGLIDESDLEQPTLVAFFGADGTVYAKAVKPLEALGASGVQPWTWRKEHPAPPRAERAVSERRRERMSERPRPVVRRLPVSAPTTPEDAERAAYPTLRGRVRAGGRAVKGASLRVVRGPFTGEVTQTTGDEPSYRLRFRGAATIRASFPGYRSQDVEVTLDSDQRVDFDLESA